MLRSAQLFPNLPENLEFELYKIDS